jgi:hypothetical protein
MNSDPVKRIWALASDRIVKALPILLGVMKWITLPVLLAASLLSRYAGGYELAVDLTICLGTVIPIQRLMRIKEYGWAAGFTLVALVFSPLGLAIKIFLLMGLTCTALLATVLAAFRAPALITHPTHSE